MRKIASMLLAAALAAGQPLSAFAAGTEVDTAEDEFKAGYDEAVVLIKAEKWDEAIVKLKSLNKADNADVNNYLGFASRKSGKWEDAVAYYEAALKIDPQHKGALEYYGAYYVERGNLDKAKEHLEKLEAACGNTDCEEYKELAAEIKAKAGT